MSEKFLEPARHESTDVGGRLIWIGALLLLGAVFVLGLIVLWLFPRAMVDRTLHLPLAPYPSPQLQPDPALDMARFYSQEMQWLNGTGWVDRTKGIVHIPIAEAMRIISEENIPGWPGVPEKPPPVQAEIPASPAPTEKPNEATQPSPSSSVAAAPPAIPARKCSAAAAARGDCIRTKAGRPAPKAKRLSRRHRPAGAAR